MSHKKKAFIIAVIWAAALGTVFLVVIYKRAYSPFRLQQKAMHHYSAGNLDDAIRLFRKIGTTLSENDSHRDNAAYFLGLSHWRNKDYPNTLQTFTRLVDEQPQSRFVPESLYHIVMCEMLMGRPEKARKTAGRLAGQFPKNAWTQYAHQYLNRTDKGIP